MICRAGGISFVPKPNRLPSTIRSRALSGQHPINLFYIVFFTYILFDFFVIYTLTHMIGYTTFFTASSRRRQEQGKKVPRNSYRSINNYIIIYTHTFELGSYTWTRPGLFVLKKGSSTVRDRKSINWHEKITTIKNDEYYEIWILWHIKILTKQKSNIIYFF